MAEEVKLLGFWSSPLVHRVIWALKLKGISYDFVEEDRHNKSELLLQSNPVHKKVPVLIHRGKAIAESAVILEYLEETWPQNYPLLPEDPYEKAIARFWIKFGEDSDIITPYFRSYKDEEEKSSAIKKSLESLQTLEEKALGDKKFFAGNNIGMVDIIYGWLTLWLEALDEIVGINLIEPNQLPRLYAWTQNFKEVPLVKENLPNYEKLIIHFRWVRDQRISAALKS